MVALEGRFFFDGSILHTNGSASIPMKPPNNLQVLLEGGGGLIRDERGVFVKAFTANFGICTTFKAEIKVALIGLQMAHELGIHTEAYPPNG